MLRSFPLQQARWNFFRRLSSQSPKIKWYHNTDVPLSKPSWYEYKPEAEPKAFVPFNETDSRRLEQAFQAEKPSVDVKEDQLFVVDLQKMQLAPIYWPGPVFEVRRGKWFTSGGKPLSQEMTLKLDQAYEAIQPVEKPEDGEAEFAAEFAKSPANAVARLNKMATEQINSNPIDFAKEKDVYNLGGGQAVIFFDEIHGALFPDSLTSFQLNVLRSFSTSSSSLPSITMIQRGHTDDLDTSVLQSVTSASVPSLSNIFQKELNKLFSKESTLGDTEDGPEQEKVLQEVMEVDLDAENTVSEKRNVDHLLLCVHGIGQILGYKYESVNFTHSINVLRNTMRHVYQTEPKYQEIAYGENFDEKNEQQKGNNRIQILPVSWRHNVSFHPRKPFDLKNEKGEPRLPSLGEINVDGVKALRNVVGDVVLDVLLYYEARYLKEIFKSVVAELNRVYHLFKEKNPDFNGKVHVLGHSLGSAIVFDLLSYQENSGSQESEEYALDFDVENCFCVGSPVGMFKLLQQKNIRPRSSSVGAKDPTEISEDYASPKCKNLYNVFHPCDPVSYRMEPLVNPKFAQYKPEAIPFALRGFNTQVQNLSQMGDDFSSKLSQASNWFKSDQATPASIDEKASSENALRDVLSSLTSTKTEKTKKTSTEKMDPEDLKQLLKMNRSGRIDYSLPMGVFSIALVSAIGAHVSYFEDEETAGFVMKEILCSNQPPVTSKDVKVLV
ncbi:putative carboxylic ester hydrolase [Clavispora lusitaniae]|uniref:Carboxylic ester hydrolase n=1 Tax=Clavispora lusitaniae TaxID=36911 RepID=A0AA91Q1F3_CLALS|nr:putative carboxylic ester hydrolase [Clavispora lusitaniae]